MITRYIDTGSTTGGNGTTNAVTGANRAYVSLSEAEAAEQADLTATGLNDTMEFICDRTNGGGTDSTAVTIDGWTTDSTHYLTIKTNTSNMHAGQFDSAKYYLQRSVGGSAIGIAESFLRVEGMQVSVDTTSGTALGIVEAGVPWSGVRVTNCIVRATVAAVVTAIGSQNNSNGAVTNIIANNLVYGFTGSGAYGIYCRHNNGSVKTLYYNNTVYNCATGIRCRDVGGSGTTSIYARNNLVIGCTTAYLESSPLAVATYNAYDTGSDPGTNGIDLSASADSAIFVDATTSNFHLVAGSTAADVGQDLSADADYAFSTDIDGQTRSGTWDVGADEIVSAPPTESDIVPPARTIRHR